MESQSRRDQMVGSGKINERVTNTMIEVRENTYLEGQKIEKNGGI